MTEVPKYYLADVPHDLRTRVLDLCFRRLYHDALELLQQHRFVHYDHDDLINFYHWAPSRLPEPDPQETRQRLLLSAHSSAAVPAAGSCGVPPHSLPLDPNRAEVSVTNGPLITDNLPTIHSSAVAGQSLNPQPSSINSSAGASLLNDLRSVLNRFVVLPDLAAETLALWIVHTYAFTLRQVTTYIGVVSPEKRCGKTTLLELLGLLANRSLTAANISPSALFRVIQETKPTLLIDEADTFLQGRDEMAGILNAGYRKGNAYVVRLADGKARKKDQPREGERLPGQSLPAAAGPREPHFGEWTQDSSHDFAQYSCWCPKVMAAIGRLPDTLADRCIVITMQRKMPGEKCERLRHLDATDYRRRCADFVREHSDALAQARPEIPATLHDRAADIWEPLLAIADLAGGDWPALARQAAQKLSATDDDLTLLGYFLKDLRALMLLKNVDRMLSRDIVSTLNPMHHRPWEDLRRGRDINEYWLGRKMTELGIHSRSIRCGETVAKGYLLADIEAAFRRYVPNINPVAADVRRL